MTKGNDRKNEDALNADTVHFFIALTMMRKRKTIHSLLPMINEVDNYV